jgi:hypothetical protein
MQELNVKLTIDELNVILESLGSQPYMRVYGLIGKLHQQAQAQLQPGQQITETYQENDSEGEIIQVGLNGH